MKGVRKNRGTKEDKCHHLCQKKTEEEVLLVKAERKGGKLNRGASIANGRAGSWSSNRKRGDRQIRMEEN